MQTKSYLLWLALLVTLGLTWQSLRTSENVVLPSSTLRKPMPQSALNQAQILQLTKRQTIESESNLFALPESAPVIRASETTEIEKPPLPTAPRLPFQYIGRWKDQAQQAVMLEANGEIMSVKVGDILLNQYQVTRINETPLGLSIEFLYQPLQQTQLLQVGIAHDEQSHP